MKKNIVVLVNNYNYSSFISDCIESIISQNIISKIIIIDDESTDNSEKKIKLLQLKYHNIILLKKKNGGQLSTFNYAVNHINSTDFVFLLDADDLYLDEYLINCINQFDENIDLIFCNAIKFKDKSELLKIKSKLSDAHSLDILESSNLARQYKIWIGASTSAIAIKGSSFKKIFPYNDEVSWRTRADDVIVFASSILGMKKRYIPSLAIAYRIHGNNHFYGRKRSFLIELRRRFAIKRLFKEMASRGQLSIKGNKKDAYQEADNLDEILLEKFHINNKLKLKKYTWNSFINNFF